MDSQNSDKAQLEYTKPQLNTIIIKKAPCMEQKEPRTQIKAKAVIEDEDYKPDGSSSKKKSSMKQIENRNIVPNVIRLIISFIQKKGKSERIVAKLL